MTALAGRRVLLLPPEDIVPNPSQPRRIFEEDGLRELAESIRRWGVLQPLTVRRRGENWELVAGERRLRAAMLAGLTAVPCLPIEAEDADSALLALTENLQRRDLHFLEEAAALNAYLRKTGETQEVLAEKLGASCADNETIVRDCDVIFLGVKPQTMARMLQPLQPILAGRRTPFVLVSMAAGVTIEALQAMAGGCYPVLRVMPNTACAVGAGMTTYTCSPEVTDSQRQTVLDSLSASGLLEEIEENLMGAGSAVAGCGGAYACLFMEGLADGGVLCGLPRKKAQRMAAQMLLGIATQALSTDEHTGALKDAVCSPGGSTIAGVRKLESLSFRSAAMEAVIAAWERDKEMQRQK